jgi:Oxidoreductase family, NAD-binding Rossmann fold
VKRKCCWYKGDFPTAAPRSPTHPPKFDRRAVQSRRQASAGTMSMSVVRIGIAGCGLAARIHLDRLLALENVEIAGCADPDHEAARGLADRASLRDRSQASNKPVPAYSDHRELLRQQSPQALAIFTPHLSHYRLTMDALQAGCHVFIEKPLTTNSLEAADIVSLARGRGLKVGVGHLILSWNHERRRWLDRRRG